MNRDISEKSVFTNVNTFYCTFESIEKREITIPIEHNIELFFNNQYIYTFHCLPQQLEELALGYLFARNLIRCKKQVLDIIISKDKQKIEIYATTDVVNYCDNVNLIFSNNFKINKLAIFALMQEFENISEIYKVTRATHTVAIADTKGIKIYCEDISRHAALDKLFGYCLLNEIEISKYMLLLSCRVTQSIAENIADKGIPVIGSLGGATDVAVNLCDKQKISLVGFVRAQKMVVFSDYKHIAFD